MIPLRTFYRSGIGKKALMATTGLIGILFVIVHMLGNLQAFLGPRKLNAYSAMLHGPAEEALWVVRIILIVAVVVHVLMAWQLTRRARAARPVTYRRKEAQVATVPSRTMRWGGVFLLAFIVFHILHFTTGSIRPAGVFVPGDVYGNVVASFRVWWVTLLYVAAMALLGMHLYHGAWSWPRSLGQTGGSLDPLRRPAAIVVAVAVWLGFTLVPLAVAVGVIR